LDLPNNDHAYYVYDAINRLTNLTEYQGSAGTTPMAAYTYTLNAANMKTRVVEGDGSSIQWSYDNAYKLQSEIRKSGSGTLTAQSFYTYTTSSSNRQSLTTGIGASQATTNYGYNLLDQLITVTTSSGNTIYSYNGRGDLTSNGSYTFGYNAADQLTSVSGGASATYQYDADGRRVQQVNGGMTTNYTWDELSPYGDVVLETNSSNAAQTSYVLGNGELVSQNKLSGSGLSYVLHDGQGNVRELLDGSTGNVRSGETYTYDAFGKLSSGQSNPDTSYLYAGQQFDNATQLYDMRARYYNPSDARFLSMDTAAVNYQNPLELNRYVYTADNPTNFSDPSGHNIFEQAILNAKTKLKAAVASGVGIAQESRLAFFVVKLRALYLQYLLEFGTRLFQARTVALGWIVDNSGQRILTVAVSNSLKYEWPKVLLDALSGDEVLLDGVGHGEEIIMRWAYQNGYKILAIGAGRKVCEEVCMNLAQQLMQWVGDFLIG
jgi:RHS repeat-associated protein